MSGDFYCAIGAALSLAALTIMVFLIRSIPRVRLFRSWRDVFESWRQTRSPFEKFIFFVLLAKYFFGGAAVAITVSVVGAALAIGTSLCGLNPDALRVIRDIINDVLRHLRNIDPPSAPTASIKNCIPTHL